MTEAVADSPWMSSTEAAACLGVARATLYAYVSRGHLRAHSDPARRGSRYRRAEVERLRARNAAARQPRQAAVQTLDWGLPVLASGLTLIENGRLYYRGRDALAWADHATLEDLAHVLWQGADAAGASELRAPSPVRTHASGRAAEPAPALDAATRRALRRCAAWPQPRRLLGAWSLLQAAAPAADEAPLRQAPVLLQRMAQAVTLGAGVHGAAHRRLQQAWRLPEAGADALRRALVLCADHELNASSFAARCVAATGAELAVCVGAGLAALSGPRHGGATQRVEAMWPLLQARQPLRTLRRALLQAAARQQQAAPAAAATRAVVPGERLPGFGHPLYPDGDPRAQALLERLPPDPQRSRFIELAREITGHAPALDFALVALRHQLGAPEGAALSVFALGRTVGWIAHALEQRADGSLIRPRALYGGPRPTPPAAAAHGRIVRTR